MKQEFGVSYTMLGGIAATYATCSALSQYPIGYLADRLGARVFLIGGLSIISLVFIAMGFTSSIAAFYALAVIAGLADGVFHPCGYAILTDKISNERAGRAYGVHAFGGFAGFAAAPMFVVPLAAYFGWQIAVMIAGVAGLFVVAALLINYALLETDTGQNTTSSAKPGASARSVLTSLPLLSMFGFYALSSTANMGLTTHAVSILIERTGFSFATVSSILPSYLWGIACGILIGGVIADYVKRLNVTASIGTFSAGAIMLLIAILPLQLIGLIVAFFLAGFAYGSTLASRDVVVRTVSPKNAAGQAFGFVNTGYGVGSAVGPVMIGWILDHGMTQMALVVPAVLIILATLFTLTALKIGSPGPDAAPAAS